MFWDKEKILEVHEMPEPPEGDPYIREPKQGDDAKLGYDREKDELVTLREEKLKYPYKTKFATSLVVLTNKRILRFKLKFDVTEFGEESFVWNGQNIPKPIWSLIGISKDSPEGLKASKWHDILLYKKDEYLEDLRKLYPDMTVGEYRRLTTLIYRQWLKNLGVSTVKANIMAGAVGAWQFVSPQWWGMK